MLKDQEEILLKIIEIIDNELPDGVIIAGDVYDKSVPSGEAVRLFDDFIYRLSKRKLQVYVISGNHDSPERISFGSRVFCSSGIYMSNVYDGTAQKVSFDDNYGTVDIYMLPFIKPAHVRRYYPDEEISSYTDAIKVGLIDRVKLNDKNRNVLITHQFVTGASRSESEDISVGGSDNVDANVFSDFDYVALGHIHGPQNIGRETIRYCGTPLKYSFSEAKHEKSVTVLELLDKGQVNLKYIPLIPSRDMRELRGTYMEITNKENYEGTNVHDYVHITLTDEEDIPDALAKLRVIYPNIMKLDYDNLRTRSSMQYIEADSVESKSPMDLFSEFYEKQNNQDMNDEQKKLMEELIEGIWEDKE
jgi:exonuclease SbcD